MQEDGNEQRIYESFNLPAEIASVDQLPMERKTRPQTVPILSACRGYVSRKHCSKLREKCVLGVMLAPLQDKEYEWKDSMLTSEGAIYSGQLFSGLREGYGTQVWPDKSKYEGYWKNDMANGKGRLTYENGEIYEGWWANDVKHGFGMFVHSDGTKYTGEWVQDAQHG